MCSYMRVFTALVYFVTRVLNFGQGFKRGPTGFSCLMTFCLMFWIFFIFASPCASAYSACLKRDTDHNYGDIIWAIRTPVRKITGLVCGCLQGKKHALWLSDTTTHRYEILWKVSKSWYCIYLTLVCSEIGCRLRIPRHMKMCILTCRSIWEAAFQEENRYPLYFSLMIFKQKVWHPFESSAE